MKRKRLTVVETSVLAHRSSETLYAYSDGSLPDSLRAGVEGHLRDCAACRQTVQEIQRLDLVLQDFPPAPNVPFSRFWSKLEERLPNRTAKRFVFFRPRQLAAGFALAILASLVGVVALASDETMPDSPLYPVKHLRQDIQLSLTSGAERPRFELKLGKQRVREAAEMLKRRRDDLAVASLNDLRALLADAAPQLEKTPSTQADAAEVSSAIDEIKTDLKAVDAANLEPDGSSGPEIAAVASAIDEAQALAAQLEADVVTTPPVVESPSPSPVNPPPSAEASPSVEAPAPSPAVSDSAPPEPAASPTDTPTPDVTPVP